MGIWTANLICVYYYILVGLSNVTCLLYQNLLIIFYFWFYLSTDIFVKLTQYNCFYSRQCIIFKEFDIHMLAYAKESRADPTHLQMRIHCGSESVCLG